MRHTMACSWTRPDQPVLVVIAERLVVRPGESVVATAVTLLAAS